MKGLEALGKITGTQNLTMYEQNECLKIIEKELKALEIIMNKLLVGCFSEEDNYSNYVMAITMSGDETLKKNMLTEQEYNLLSEVLVCH